MRVLVAIVTELCTHFILQWYETHNMLCNGMKCIPVLILKSQTFSQPNNFSQMNKFFVSKVFDAFNVFKVSSLLGIRSMDLLDPFSSQLHHVAFDKLKSHTPFPCPAT